MRKKAIKPKLPKLPSGPLTDSIQDNPKLFRKALEVKTIKVDRIALKSQDETIQEMHAEGYEHYDTFPITSGEIGLRFRRNA